MMIPIHRGPLSVPRLYHPGVSWDDPHVLGHYRPGVSLDGTILGSPGGSMTPQSVWDNPRSGLPQVSSSILPFGESYPKQLYPVAEHWCPDIIPIESLFQDTQRTFLWQSRPRWGQVACQIPLLGDDSCHHCGLDCVEAWIDQSFSFANSLCNRTA